MRKLSTNLTPFWRIYAVAWVSFFSFYSLSRIFDFFATPASDLSAGQLTLFVSLAAASSIFTHFVAGTLKTVVLDGNSLVISNFLKQIRVPLSNVSHVDNPDLTSLRRIKVIFLQPTEFGAEIVFAPPLFEARETAKLLKSKIQTNYLSL